MYRKISLTHDVPIFSRGALKALPRKFCLCFNQKNQVKRNEKKRNETKDEITKL